MRNDFGSDLRPPDPDRSRPMGPVAQLLRVHDVAEVLGVGDRYVYRLVSERRIPYIKCGHYVRFDPDEIRSWLDDARIEPTARQP